MNNRDSLLQLVNGGTIDITEIFTLEDHNLSIEWNSDKLFVLTGSWALWMVSKHLNLIYHKLFKPDDLDVFYSGKQGIITCDTPVNYTHMSDNSFDDILIKILYQNRHIDPRLIFGSLIVHTFDLDCVRFFAIKSKNDSLVFYGTSTAIQCLESGILVCGPWGMNIRELARTAYYQDRGFNISVSIDPSICLNDNVDIYGSEFDFKSKLLYKAGIIQDANKWRLAIPSDISGPYPYLSKYLSVMKKDFEQFEYEHHIYSYLLNRDIPLHKAKVYEDLMYSIKYITSSNSHPKLMTIINISLPLDIDVISIVNDTITFYVCIPYKYTSYAFLLTYDLTKKKDVVVKRILCDDEYNSHNLGQLSDVSSMAYKKLSNMGYEPSLYHLGLESKILKNYSDTIIYH